MSDPDFEPGVCVACKAAAETVVVGAPVPPNDPSREVKRKPLTIAPSEEARDDDFDDDYEHECSHCHGEGFILICIDDMCHGQGWCMHGDGEIPCRYCA